MVEDQEFTVKISLGEVYVNGKFVSQCCWDAESVGYAIISYLNDDYDKDDEDEEE